MISNKRILALTPARGGSKGLPGKNIKPFCGKPLLAHSITIAKNSKYIDTIVISTDCEEIAKVAKDYEAEVSNRPKKLASDSALVADTIREMLKREYSDYDYIVLLEATSPLRSAELVDSCIETIINQNADSVATFSESDPPPTRLWKIKDNLAETYFDNANPWLPRQQQEPAYHLNGLVYVFNVERFIASDAPSIFFGKSAAVTTTETTVDIDTIDDFNMAEYLMRIKNENVI